MASSGMLRNVALVRTDVSEELSASIISVTRIGELGKTLAVTSNRRTLRRNCIDHSHIGFVTSEKHVSKAIPVTVRGGLERCEMLRIPHCLDSRFTDGGKVVRITDRLRCTQQKLHLSLALISVRLSKPQGLVRTKGLRKFTKCNYPVGSRTCDLLPCQTVIQPERYRMPPSDK
jgi:hypothetical protein